MQNLIKSKLAMLIIAVFLYGQSIAGNNCWKPVEEVSLSGMGKMNRNTIPSTARYYELNMQQLQSLLQQAPNRGQQSNLIIDFPDAYGNMNAFRVYASPIMPEMLSSKYPMIKTYCAQGINDPTATMRFSVTQFGLHCMTLSGTNPTNYIDTYTKDLNYYIVYDKASLANNVRNFECLTDEDAELPSMRNGVAGINNNTDDQLLRTYRLALTCTAEYGNIFATTPGSEKADIMAQMTITMNRVNGVYERDLAITMEFVPNNDTLIFYGNTSQDPWSNEWNTKTAQVCDQYIGVANYDIGHNFNTTGGGNAGCIACVCLSSSQSGTHKGRGMTGSANPVGDPFDIDYVAHEMGHQYGGYHIMNTCSRSGSGNTEVEPCSGSSIMGYAGICSVNIQAHSDDDFNYVNVRDISANIQNGSSTCAVTTPLTDNPPTADAGADYTIPKGTAFVLEGSATDADGMASLTYNWCQNDAAQAPSNSSPQPTWAVGPLSRAIKPGTSPNRYMPNLRSVVLKNLYPTWEKTSDVARTLNYSFIVRDNDVNGGQTASDLMQVTVASAGPFVVTSQNTPTNWNAGASETVTWNVAGTDIAPVNTPFVNIFLSLDSGFTYPYTLATNVPNNGSASIVVPAGAASQWGRVMVRGAGNIFYALNGSYINIQASEFVMNMSSTAQSVCPPNDITYNFMYNTFLAFNETTVFSITGLPAGATGTFTPATAVNDSTPVQLLISGLTPSMTGTYNLTITGTSPSVTKTTSVTLDILDVNLPAATLTLPADGSSGIASIATLTWQTAASPGTLYDIEVATDSLFTNVIASATGISTNTFTTTPLLSSTTYYWHVKSYNSCFANSYSAAWSFTTNNCSNLASANVPVVIPSSGAPTVTSTLNIASAGTITDVNVVGLNGTHTWISDLTISIKSPQNTTVTLFDQICTNENDFDCNFDDAAAPGALPCPPIGGGTYNAVTPLSVFNGQQAAGNWTLTVTDHFNSDGGSLNGWGLEICTTTPTGIETHIVSTSMILYPNPVKELLNVNVAGKKGEQVLVEIKNITGQVIKSISVNANTKISIDVKDLSAGMYFVTATGSNIETQRFIKAK
ncbi:MAG TPA: zinc-dependent metalloprotease family protein [Bacteroidia bacterium]|nr:proprotein convertase P-domain-containing protein [Bacteroidia bacterium]HOZ82302.1 zinc-dependent metalloprotease family protein [Bacteroidia bacterium]HQW16484.1 zinc-dependent metalloprotease family protein [Bacteroidia bacterium]HQW47886.1 zinc-dependent metalloprotease family protein [Bacteroidia bacterium]HQX70697.1 zinc-dependent metalloprotease family protein [Bacteroidia bacterium]